jgi:Ser/Thr protein kinase RdoA (MazF antagonist)
VAIAPETIPRFTASDALEAAFARYGLSGSAAPLPSERDQNFLIADPRRGKFVLKIANRGDSAELLDFQHEGMRRVAARGCGIEVPRIVPSLAGADVETLPSRAGAEHRLRVLTWIDGRVLAEQTPRGDALLESIGASMAQVDLALAEFAHPAMERVLQWDLRHAGIARAHAPLLPDTWRGRVQAAFERWQQLDWTSLRPGVIHGDANDHNVLVERDRMTGLLDFGDMVHSAIVCELAVALAYAMLGERDPLAAAAAVIRGYHRHNPLTVPEQLALDALVRARLAASLCYAAHNKIRDPGDPYQVVSEAGVRALFERLDGYPHGAAEETVRAACGTPRASPRTPLRAP